MTTAPLSTPSDSRVGRLDYWLSLAFLAVIRLYQRTLSRLLPPACRFEPSCSHYAAAALQQHRLPRALALTAWRLLRCQPLCTGGCDPVPPGRWNGRWLAVPPPQESSRVTALAGAHSPSIAIRSHCETPQ